MENNKKINRLKSMTESLRYGLIEYLEPKIYQPQEYVNWLLRDLDEELKKQSENE